jgi:plasmid stability protein
MPALTIKNFPDKLLNALRREAESRRRSVTQEVLKRLEESVAGKNHVNSQLAEDQVEAWRKLSGKWNSHLSVKEEIDQLYRARKRGRKIKL